MNQTLILAINSITLGGLLFLLSAGFSLIFGLMRIPNLIHGSLFMLGAYVGATFAGATFVSHYKLNFWLAAALDGRRRRARSAAWSSDFCCGGLPASSSRRCW